MLNNPNLMACLTKLVSVCKAIPAISLELSSAINLSHKKTLNRRKASSLGKALLRCKNL